MVCTGLHFTSGWSRAAARGGLCQKKEKQFRTLKLNSHWRDPTLAEALPGSPTHRCRCARMPPPRPRAKGIATQATRSGGGAFLLVQAERHVVAHGAEAAALRVECHAPHLRGRSAECGVRRDSAEGCRRRRVPRVPRGAMGPVRVLHGCRGVLRSAVRVAGYAPHLVRVHVA